MVTIRLSRHGCKKRPFYHIVVADKPRARDGRYIEQLGYYDPSRPDAEIRLNHERLNYWKSVGAEVSARVQRVAADHLEAGANTAESDSSVSGKAETPAKEEEEA